MTVLNLDADLRAAVRTRLLALAAYATTGTLTNVSVAGRTYTRAAGSFLTDGFRPGDQINAAGFGQTSNNGRALIVSAAATTLSVDRDLTTESAGASVTIAAGLWGGSTGISWEGRAFTPAEGVPYISEALRTVWSEVRARGIGGTIGHRHDAVLRLNYPAGRDTNGIERQARALCQHFEPGTQLAYGDHTAIVLRAERTPLDSGPVWITCTVIAELAAYTASQPN